MSGEPDAAGGTLDRLAAAVSEDGGLLAAALVAAPRDATTAIGDIAASGSRAADHPADLALVVEAVFEGASLHHGTGRIVSGEDPDLALLAGDRLYALGLERLAAAGDLESVEILARVIAEVAVAAARDLPQEAAAAWETGARQIAGHLAPGN